MMVPIHALQWYRFADTVTKFNRYFNETYRGNLLPPGNSGTNGAKNNKKYTTEEYNLFVSEVSKLTKNMNKAMNISISSIACAN